MRSDGKLEVSIPLGFSDLHYAINYENEELFVWVTGEKKKGIL